LDCQYLPEHIWFCKGWFDDGKDRGRNRGIEVERRKEKG